MKILFIGGTGRLSKDVAELALKKGNEVFLLTRGSKERKKFVQAGYQMIYGNIRKFQNSKELLGGIKFDVIIDFLSFDVDQLKNTLEIIGNHYNQYIFISTATVYKKNLEDEIISEENTLVGNDKWAYALKKYQCEEYLKGYFSPGKDTHYTVIRPYVTYGNTRVPYPIVPSDTTKEWSFLDRIIHNQPIPVFDNGETITTLTHTRDFAKGVVGLFGNEKAFGQAFHITNDETHTWGEVLCSLENAMKKSIVRLDVTQKQIFDTLPQYRGILEGDKGTTMIFSNRKIVSAVPNFVCEVSFDSGVKEMIDFYYANKDVQLIDYRWQGEIDKLCAKYGAGNTRKYYFKSMKDYYYYFSGRYTMIGGIDKLLKLLKYVVLKISKKR